MKALIISTSIIIGLLLCWIFIYNFICDISNELTILLTNIENDIENEQWYSAKENLKLVEIKWNKALKLLKSTIDHDEIEKINLSLTKTKKYISTQNKNFLISETAALKFHINHIKEKEALSLNNIF